MKKIKLRSKEWFDNPKDPGLTAIYLERYLNYGLKRKDLQSGKPIIVFIGSSLALISSSVVGVLVGKWISKKISPSKFALFTGALMMIISIFLALDTIKNYL